VSELHEQLIDLLNAEAIFLRQQLAEEIEERDAAEMRSVAHLKMYTEASQQLAELTKERDEQCAGKMAFFGGMNDMREQRTTLERQLTKVTSEKQYHMDCINLLATHIGRLGDTSNTVVDAAIQQLAEVGEQNLELQRNAILLINKIEALRQQLAAMTAERDEAVSIATGLIAWAPITDADVKWAEAKLAAQKHQGGLP